MIMEYTIMEVVSQRKELIARLAATAFLVVGMALVMSGIRW